MVVAFQPHRYPRTRDCLELFADVLSSVDEVVLAEVYPAGEAPIEGADSEHLADAVAERTGRRPTVSTLEDLPAAIARTARAGDVVVTMGAGSIGRIPAKLTGRNE